MFYVRCSICDKEFQSQGYDDICPKCRREINRNKNMPKRMTVEEQTEANAAWARKEIQNIDTLAADYYTRKDYK